MSGRSSVDDGAAMYGAYLVLFNNTNDAVTSRINEISG